MTSLPHKLPPSIVALLLQLTAILFVFLAISMLGLHPTPLVSALLCGVIAAIFSRIAGMAPWWLFIQFAFAPALVLMLPLGIPSGYFLAAFLVMLVVYWSTFRTQVPFYLSSDKVWQALETRLPAEQAFSFIDLGSGIGGVSAHLALTHPHGRYHGVESAPLPFLWNWLRIRFGGYRNCTVHWGSMWDCDLSKYDVVFAYLSPAPMGRLWHKVKQEMSPGSLFISNTFAVPDHPPQESIAVADLHGSTLYLWRM